ncbi:MAG: hypothetical protein ACXWCM_12835 [Acidimicrobiales bacterium]
MSRVAARLAMAYNGRVRFKTGLLVGLAVGYYYGAKAGRERYLQLDRYLAQIRSTDAYQELRVRLGDLAVEGISRGRDMVDEVAFGGGGASDSPYDYRGDPTLN